MVVVIRKRMLLSLVIICLGMKMSNAQQVIQLWPEVAGAANKDTPTLTVYPADTNKATGAAIIICPGGAYRGLAKHEGEDYAKFLTPYGITAFVLKYRLGSDGYKYKEISADAARAMRIVRAKRAALAPQAECAGHYGIVCRRTPCVDVDDAL